MRISFGRNVTCLTVVAAATALGLATPTPAVAQDAASCYVARDPAGRPSPLDSASVRLMGAEAKVCFGRPSANDREVMGGLVPFDQPWRTGANEATALHLAFPATVAGVALEPGSYALYTVPGEERWEIVLGSNYERWGIPISGDDVVGSGSVAVEHMSDHVETMTLRFEAVSGMEAHLILEWETTRIRIPVAHRH
jgi:hypothetical protein